MKKIMKFKFLIFTSFLVFACSDSLEFINIDPNNPTDVPLNFLLPEAQSSAAFNEGNGANRAAGILLQQFFGVDAQQLAYNSYLFTEDLLNNYWRTGLYAGPLRSCQVIIDKAAEDDRPYYAGVAKIIMAKEFGIATSFLGDIPFSESLQGTDILQPAYDSQELVYNGVQDLLSQAISELGSLTGDGGYFGGDIIFDGDAAAWIKVAHAFKARFYLHTSKRTGNFSQAVAESQMAMSSNSENPIFQFETSQTANAALAKFGIERPSTLGIHENFAAMMEGDPRMDVYMYTDGTTWWYFDADVGGNMFWAQSALAQPLITYVEMKFIQAEAIAAGGGDATAALANAVGASFDILGMGGADDYIATLPDASHETVVTEAYKAYYGYNFHETWANWRRTGFPALTPAANASGGLNPSGAIPQRFLYVESETQTNSANVAAARAAQGGALLDVPVWAFE